MQIIEEYLVDTKPLSQSTGHVLAGGDCGYCCFSGILQLPTILSAYELIESFMDEERGWKRRESMSAFRTEEFFKQINYEFKPFRPPFDHYHSGLTEVPWENNNWAKMAKEVIKSGSILLSSIRFKKSAPPPPYDQSDPSSSVGAPNTDHNVIVNGYRYILEPHPTVKSASSYNHYFRTSCSVKGDYWMQPDIMLYYHGYYPSIIINPEELRILINKLTNK